MKIDYLFHHSEFVKPVADWLKAEWGQYYPERMHSDWVNELHFKEKGLPATLVGYEERENFPPVLLATATIKIQGLSSHPQLKNWVYYVYTNPEYRGKGYAQKLLARIINMAQLQGLEALYLFTHTAAKLYEGLGWENYDHTEYKGLPMVVMKHPFLL